MDHHLQGAGRAITDYFNSPSFHAVKESGLLEAIMVELMQSGTPVSNSAIIANVMTRLGQEQEPSVLLDCRRLLAEVLKVQE